MRSLALAVAALALCHCSRDRLVYTGPHLTVTPAPGAGQTRLLEFGQVRVSSRTVLPVTVLNDGRQDATVRASLDPAGAAVLRGLFEQGAAITLHPGDTLPLPIEYAPAAVGEHRGKVSLTSDVPGEERLEVLLHGSAVTSALQICRVDSAGESCDDQLSSGVNLAADFGALRPGDKLQRTLVLRARGDASIHLSSIALTAQSDAAFSLSGVPAMPHELALGQELRLTATFSAALGGAAVAQLEVRSDSSFRPRELVDLAGQGIAPRLCIDAGALDFGDVSVFATARRTVQLRSCGLQPLQLSSISTQAPFSLDGAAPALPQTLLPGAALPLALSFKPAVTGPQQQPLAIATNEARPGSFALTGFGVQCVLALQPAPLDFGQVSTAVKASRTLLLRAVGYSQCTVTGLRRLGSATGFSVPSPPALPLVVTVGLDVPLEVDFQPPGAGAASDQLAVDSDDSTAATQLVPLRGQGVAPPPCDFAAFPAQLAFGAVDVGHAVTAPVQVTNRGTQECSLTSVAVTGDPSFTAAGPSGFPPPTLASGASLAIPVTFTPSSSALHSATLTLKYSVDPFPLSGSRTLAVPLQGGALQPRICVSPTALDFGTVAAGSRAVKQVAVQSCGDGTLTLRGIQPAAGTSAEFSLVSPPAVPVVLPKGASITLSVEYQPASAAPAAGRLQIFSNDAGLPTARVDLRGNPGACAAQLVCTPASLDFAGTQVGRTTAQPVACTATGSALTVSAVAAAPGTSGDLTLQAGHLPVTLQPGDVLRAQVQFAPSSAGAVVGSFAFQTGGCGDARVSVTALGQPAALPPCPAIAAFTPKVKWAWNGGSQLSSWSNVVMTPAVATLTGAGAVSQTDPPDVVFSSCSAGSCCVNCLDPQHMEKADLSGEGVLRAVSGKDGSELWTAADTALHVPAATQIAIADINGDGAPEIIAVQHTFRTGQTCPGSPVDSLPMCGKYVSGNLLVFDRGGKLLFVSEPWSQPATVVENDSSILVADLDQDGDPEIIFGDTVFDSTGHVKWRMSGTVGNGGHGTFLSAVDVDGDGRLELVAGPTAYRADGTVLWTTPHVDDGMTLVMDTDGDGKPEVIVRPTAARIVVLDGATGSIKRDINLPEGKDQGGIASGVCPAGPSAGDFLGNGRMQLAVPAGNWFYLLRPDTGEIVWQKPIDDYDGQCGASGAAVFSFFGDGRSDVVYHDTQHIFVWRGDGTEVYRAPRASSTLFETPVIADVDGDGHAEILITNQGAGGTSNGLTALADQAGSWPATRGVWTQWSYHVTDANENATVPRIEQPFWKTSRLWRGNPALCTR